LLLLLRRRLSPTEATAGGQMSLQGSLLLELGAAWSSEAVELELVALLEVLAIVLIVESRKSSTSAVLVPALLALVLLEWIVPGRAVASIVSLSRTGLHLPLTSTIHLVLFVVVDVPLPLLTRIHQ